MMRSVIKINGLLLFTFLINVQYNNTISREREKKTKVSISIKTNSPIKDPLPTVKVLSIEKENTRIASTGEDLGKQCDKWQLDKPTIEKIFKASKQISGEEHHYLYDVWPCDMKGEILINRDTFSFEVNPGSYMVIWNRDKQLYYGCTNKKFEKYFLSKVWDPKNGE
jgi:hypothetical protein